MQVGALPVRRSKNGKPRILLVTTRSKDRWIIPKGGRSKRLSDRRAAEREAMEEGGVLGDIRNKIGVCRYERRSKGVAVIDVYLLKVRDETECWPERGQRKRAWVSPKKAKRMVTNKGLRRLIDVVASR
jgi:8-oxo-dGTP pyrophosphatase MutT (NUDIX family)